MHSDQIPIDARLAAELIHDQFPTLRGQEVTALATAGTVSAIFRIGSTHVARFPLRMIDPAECATVLEAEARASAEFHRCCPFESPNPVAMGCPGAGYPLPWMVLTWVEGQPAGPDGPGNAPALALDLVRLITTLRAVDLDGRTFDGRGRGGLLASHDDWMEVCFARSERLLDVERLRRMWAGFRRLPPTTQQAMSHKDLIPANLLVRGDRLVGVIDTGGFGPADPALDLVVGWHVLDRRNRAILRDGLKSDDLEWRRGAAWAFQQAMGLVWYYADSNRTMSELGRSTISRLLEADDELM